MVGKHILTFRQKMNWPRKSSKRISRRSKIDPSPWLADAGSWEVVVVTNNAQKSELEQIRSVCSSVVWHQPRNHEIEGSSLSWKYQRIVPSLSCRSLNRSQWRSWKYQKIVPSLSCWSLNRSPMEVLEKLSKSFAPWDRTRGFPFKR